MPSAFNKKFIWKKNFPILPLLQFHLLKIYRSSRVKRNTTHRRKSSLPSFRAARLLQMTAARMINNAFYKNLLLFYMVYPFRIILFQRKFRRYGKQKNRQITLPEILLGILNSSYTEYNNKTHFVIQRSTGHTFKLF